MPFRTYEHFKQHHDKHVEQYGAYWSRGQFLHKCPDESFDISYYGRRITNINKDSVFTFYVDGQTVTAAVARRWADALGYNVCSFGTSKKQTASGLVTTKVYLLGRNGVENQSIECHEKFTFDVNTQTLSGTDAEEVVVEKDNAKYTAYNRKLKKIIAAVVAQNRFGVYNYCDGESRWRPQVQGVFKEACPWAYNGAGYLQRTATEVLEKANELIADYNATNSPDALKQLGVLALIITSNPIRTEQFRTSAIRNFFRRVQVQYLRTECVTISKSIPPTEAKADDSEDQDRVVLPPAGL